MPVRRGLVGSPRDYLAAEGAWPAGPYRTGTPSAVYYAAHIATQLSGAITGAGLTHTEASRRLEIGRPTLYNILSGKTFPDLHTLAKAEDAFPGLRVWPDRDGDFMPE